MAPTSRLTISHAVVGSGIIINEGLWWRSRVCIYMEWGGGYHNIKWARLWVPSSDHPHPTTISTTRRWNKLKFSHVGKYLLFSYFFVNVQISRNLFFCENISVLFFQKYFIYFFSCTCWVFRRSSCCGPFFFIYLMVFIIPDKIFLLFTASLLLCVSFSAPFRHVKVNFHFYEIKK